MANKKEVMVYPQSFTDTEKAIARNNIGAAATPTHEKVVGGMCNVKNFEKYDKILGINNNTSPNLPIGEDTIKLEYFSYHAGSFQLTSKLDGEVLITGTRHVMTTVAGQTPIDERININATVQITKDVRTSLAGIGFSLSGQEISRNDIRIDWDLIITFRESNDSSFGDWWNPLHVKISRTPDLKIITGV